MSPSIAPRTHAYFLAECALAGFVPSVVQEVMEPNTLLSLVESGFGIGLLPETARFSAPRSVTFRPTPWLRLKWRVHLIRSHRKQHALAERFAAFAAAGIKP